MFAFHTFSQKLNQEESSWSFSAQKCTATWSFLSHYRKQDNSRHLLYCVNVPLEQCVCYEFKPLKRGTFKKLFKSAPPTNSPLYLMLFANASAIISGHKRKRERGRAASRKKKDNGVRFDWFLLTQADRGSIHFLKRGDGCLQRWTRSNMKMKSIIPLCGMDGSAPTTERTREVERKRQSLGEI